jgi:pimeloyl-ACP methyl ester carboxylesterase
VTWGRLPAHAGTDGEHLQPVYHLLLAGTLQVSVLESIVSPGGEVHVRLTHMPGNPDDWVGIYPVGADNDWDNQVGWAWAPQQGAQTVTISIGDLASGMYEARVFFKNSFELEGKCAFLVYPSTAILRPVYADAAHLPELSGSEYGAMGEHPVRKVSVASPWPPYAGDSNVNVDIYYPADGTGKRPTVFFISGYGQYHSETYRSLLYFIASQGYTCVFVPHKNTNPDFHPELLLTILDGIVDAFSPIIDTSRVGYVGHSEGGGLIYYLARARAGWGGNGRFLFSMAAWWGFNLPETGDVDYPVKTNLIVQMGNPAHDTGTDPRQNIDLLLHNNIPAERKTYLYLPGDDQHTADHGIAYSTLVNGEYSFDALEQVGLYRPLEALMHYSFGDDDPRWKYIGLPDPGDANYNTPDTFNGITVLSTDDPLGNHTVPIPAEDALDSRYLCSQHDPQGYYNPRWQMCMPCKDTSRDAPWQQCREPQ